MCQLKQQDFITSEKQSGTVSLNSKFSSLPRFTLDLNSWHLSTEALLRFSSFKTNTTENLPFLIYFITFAKITFVHFA